MMTRPKHFGTLLCFGLVGLLAMICLWLPGGLELRVTTVKNNRLIFVAPLNPGERFTLHYYHSVENAPIWEVHSLDQNGQIYIEEERYLKFGAGMGRMPGIGKMKMQGPFEAIEEMHMPTGNFVLRVGSKGVDHTLIWRNTRTNLSDRVAHKAVQFSGRRVSLMHRLWRRCIPHDKTPIQDSRTIKKDSRTRE